MSRTTRRLTALLVPLALVAAACGGDDDAEPAEEPAAEEPAAEEPAAEEPAAEEPAEEPAAEEPAAEEPAEEPATEEPAAEEPAEAPGTDELVATFDANGDGTITIGVAAAGPRDDNGYYQSLVDFAERFSEENGFAAPIVSDNIGSAEAAQSMADLAQQGVDIIFVGASEIAEPLPDLTEQFPDIFWYCNCGAGFQELPGLAQATDWGAAIHYTAGVAMAETLREQGGNQAVFLGCCDLNFEREAYNATLAGMATVDPSYTMEYVGTGDFQFDFDNGPNATAALTNAIANGATLAYAYLGGATDPVGQLATDEGVAVFAAGPANICDRDDGIAWTGSVVFDGGLYAERALRLIIDGELTEGTTFQFPTEEGLNGALLCDPSPEVAEAVTAAFDAVATDGELLGVLGGISGEAYSGG
jgi:basic membrane lipoprotein Med (substrate-binding protein (PBP1-ABC) superfamily)